MYLVGEIEVQNARRCLASSRVHGHENQAVAAWGKILNRHEHTDRHDWAAFQEEFVGSDAAGKKDFFIGSSFVNFVSNRDARWFVS